MIYTRLSFLVISLCTGAFGAGAQVSPLERLEESPRHHEWVSVDYGKRTVRTFVVYPEVPDPATAVVVIHENRGLNDWARSFADQLAEQGFIAVAPDLLSGSGPDGQGTTSFASSDEARTAIYALDPAQVTADLQATINYAKKIPAANGKVAVVGFCWGGSQAFQIATGTDALDAAFVCYGSAPEDEKELARITAPVYGFYGGNDNRINASIPATAEAMNDMGKVYDPVIYEGAGHGFFRTGELPDATEENKKARADAFSRMLRLLDGIE